MFYSPWVDWQELAIAQQVRDVGFMLGHRLSGWPNMKSTLGHVFAG